jgi:hypothetical protein
VIRRNDARATGQPVRQEVVTGGGAGWIVAWNGGRSVIIAGSPEDVAGKPATPASSCRREESSAFSFHGEPLPARIPTELELPLRLEDDNLAVADKIARPTRGRLRPRRPRTSE